MKVDSVRTLAHLLALAARQAWGQRRRTFLIALVISLGNAALLLQLAQGHGQAQAFTSNMIRALSGHLQIHRNRPDAQSSSLFEAKLQDALPLAAADALEAAVRREPHVVATTQRVRFGAMVSNGDSNWSGFVIGADAANERKVCDAIALSEGRFVAAGAKEIVVSAAMARDHGLKVGDSLTVLASTASRSFNAMELRIVGLLSDTGLSKFYAHMVYVPIERARQLAAIDGDASYELVVRLDDTARTDEIAAALRKAHPEDQVSTWVDLGGLFIGILEVGTLFRAAMAAFLGTVTLILVFSGFSVYVLERGLEVATLRALGMRRREVLVLLVAEGIVVALTAALAGLVVGGGVSLWLGHVGIPAFNEALTYAFAGDRLYPALRWSDLALLLSGTVAIVTVAAWFPVQRVLGRDLVQMLNRS